MGIGKVVTGAVAGLGLVGAGYAGLGGLDVDRDDTGAITEEGELGAFRIRTGDCVNGMSGTGAVESVTGVPCDTPHEAEAYHAFNLPDGAFPGDAAVATSADDGCLGAFAGFVGVPYEQSTLEITWLVPTVDGWNDSQLRDREVLCFVINPDFSPLTGSAQGLAS